MGWAGGLVWFPSKHRWTQEKTKIGALQNACPKFISRPQTQSSYKFVSYRMVGLEICLTVLLCLTCTCPTFPGKPRRFLQNGMVDQKKILTKCLRLLQKCPWNGTWVKPFHSGNIQRDAKGPKQSGISHSALLNYQRGTDSAWTPNTPGTSGW